MVYGLSLYCFTLQFYAHSGALARPFLHALPQCFEGALAAAAAGADATIGAARWNGVRRNVA